MHRHSTIQHYESVLNGVETYLEMNYEEPFGIPQLTEQVHLSYHHLARVFEQNRGESLGSYISRKKLERAATLYAYSALTLSEIADRTGYATKHSLSKAFVKHFRLSPGSFIKQSLYDRRSPNIIFDGISCRKEYEQLMQTEIPVQYDIVDLHHCYFSGTFCSAAEGDATLLNDNPQQVYSAGTERYFLKAFDSINFSPVRSFRMLAGTFHSGIKSPQHLHDLQLHNPGRLILPVKPGRYLRFDVPAGNAQERGLHITICRENQVRFKKLFTLWDFYDFFLFENVHSNPSGHYYMRIN